MEQPKVLVGVPIFEGMRYCLKEFLEGVRSLSYKNKDLLLVDNSQGDDFFNELKKEKDFIILKDDTKSEVPKERLVSSRNKILDYGIERGYEYIFMVDSDVLAPKEIIEELLKWDKDIVSGLYYNYFRSSGEVKWLPACWRAITKKEFEEIRTKMNLPSIVKSHEDLRRHLTKAEAESGKLFEVFHPSAGCMLICRKVFERIRYGLLDLGGIRTGDDNYFVKKAREAGFRIYCDTKMKCEHLIKGKFKRDREGNIIHPLHPDYNKAG